LTSNIRVELQESAMHHAQKHSMGQSLHLCRNAVWAVAEPLQKHSTGQTLNLCRNAVWADAAPVQECSMGRR